MQAIKRNSQVGQELVGNQSCVINFYNCASCWKKLIIISMWMQVCTESKTILSVEDIISLIGSRCDGVIGQVWICFSNPLDMFFSSPLIRSMSVPPLWLSVRCIFKAITVILSWIELVCVVDRGLGWNPLCHFEEGWGPCLQQHGCWLQQCWCWSCHSTWHSSWQHPCMLSHLLFRIVKSSVVISSWPTISIPSAVWIWLFTIWQRGSVGCADRNNCRAGSSPDLVSCTEGCGSRWLYACWEIWRLATISVCSFSLLKSICAL